MRPLDHPIARSLIAAAALLALPCGAAAQRINGRLVEPGGAPLDRVMVVLSDNTGRRVDATVTDSTGVFELKAPAAGRYVVVFEGDGESVRLGPFELRAGVTLVQQLVAEGALADVAQLASAPEPAAPAQGAVAMAPAPAAESDTIEVYHLAAVNATGTRSADFDRRRRSGRGFFLTRAEIERKGATRTFDLFRGIPGVRLEPGDRGGYKVVMAGAQLPRYSNEAMPADPMRDPKNRAERARLRRLGMLEPGTGKPAGTTGDVDGVPVSDRAGAGDCQVQYYVDGALFYPSEEGNISADVNPWQIEALEVYRNSAETPVEFRRSRSDCGVVVIWLRH